MNRLLPGAGAWICLLVILGVVAWVLFRLRAYWRDDTDRDAGLHELLTQFRESQREGVLTAEEYRLIKSRLVQPRPAAETERRDSAEQSTESAKGIAAPPTGLPAAGEISTRPHHPR